MLRQPWLSSQKEPCFRCQAADCPFPVHYSTGLSINHRFPIQCTTPALECLVWHRAPILAWQLIIGVFKQGTVIAFRDVFRYFKLTLTDVCNERVCSNDKRKLSFCQKALYMYIYGSVCPRMTQGFEMKRPETSRLRLGML